MGTGPRSYLHHTQGFHEVSPPAIDNDTRRCYSAPSALQRGMRDGCASVAQLFAYCANAPFGHAQCFSFLLIAIRAHLSAANPESYLETALPLAEGLRALAKLHNVTFPAHSVDTDSPGLGHFLALHHIAQGLHERSHHAEALKLFREIFEATKDDLFATRHCILPLLVQQGANREALDLSSRYASGEPIMLFHRALALSPTPLNEFESVALAANAKNSRIVPLLLGQKSLPKEIPPRHDLPPGSVKEAVWYAHHFRAIWEQTPNALVRLRTATTRMPGPSRARGRSTLITPKEREAFVSNLTNCNLNSRPQLLAFLHEHCSLLFDRQPWVSLGEQPVFVRIDEHDDNRSIAAHFSGQLGQLRGANIYSSLAAYDEIADPTPFGDPTTLQPFTLQTLSAQHGILSQALWLSLEDPRTIDPQITQELRHFKRAEHQTTIPVPAMKRPGFHVWRASDDELVLGIFGLLGLMYLASERRLERDAVLTVILERFPELFSAFQKRLPNHFGHSPLPDLARPEAISALRKLNEAIPHATKSTETWELGVAMLPHFIQARPIDRPALAGTALCASRDSGLVLGADVFSGDMSPARAAFRALRKAVVASGLRPEKLVLFDSPMCRPLAPSLCGLDACLDPEPAEFLRAAAGIQNLRPGDMPQQQH